MNQWQESQDRVANVFEMAFGKTPLDERVKDIHAQAISISRFRDLNHLKQELGEILCSALQLCNECEWQPQQLISEALKKIEERADIYQRLGRKLRVGLLGGAFDPIHVSHIELAQAVLSSGLVDEVWLMPCFEHIGGKSMSPAGDRLEMCRLAIEGVRGLRVFDYEIEHQFRGESYHLVKRLLGDSAFRNSTDFHMIVGQDNADGLCDWSNGSPLERLLPFIVVPRKGCNAPRPNSWYLHPPHLFVDSPLPQIATSSTEVRRLIERNDQQVAQLLPPNVLSYIRDRGLYAAISKPTPAQRIAVYSAPFNPPSLSDLSHVEALLSRGFDKVIIHLTGTSNDRSELAFTLPKHRAAMASLAFQNMHRVEIDFDDISNGTRTSLNDLEHRYSADGQVWLVVGNDQIKRDNLELPKLFQDQESGKQLWQSSRFAVLACEGEEIEASSMPPNCELVLVPPSMSSNDLRSKVLQGQNINEWIGSDVADYIHRHRLFIPGAEFGSARLCLENPRLFIVYDERNAKAVAIAEQYRRFCSDSPNVILVIGGDGTMLRAIRDHWRRRLPFVGLNSGHLGFLMNEQLPVDLRGLELISQSLPLLRIDAKHVDGLQSVHLAYTDVWLERAEGQAAWLRIEINGQTRLSKVVGDGMLVATAAGSSAYARAMGAVPVPIDSQSLTLAGSNIFQPRFWKPMNLPVSSRITMTNIDTVGKRPLRAFVDGAPLGIVQEISVRQSLTAGVELAFTKEFEPSAKLLRSLFPPEME